MRYAYYPGCASESTARDQHQSSLAVSRALGIELVEIPGWTCCGATPAHHTDPVLAAALSAANLAAAREMEMDVVVNCAACYSRLKSANHQIKNRSGMRENVSEAMGQDYDGSVRVRHLVEVLLEDVGEARLKEAVVKPLGDLAVAAYYGCLLVRPNEVTGFDDPENPTSLERLVSVMGGNALDWPCKLDCCGNSMSMTTRSDLVVGFVDRILGMAGDAGAECVVVACPLCQVNLDIRQEDIRMATGREHGLPVIYLTQLLGLSLGLGREELGMEKLVVSPAVIESAVEAAVHSGK